jgi:hypothetical protein
MKSDFSSAPLDREFIVMREKGHIYNGQSIRYDEDQHARLASKLHILENTGLISEVTWNNTTRYRISEEFAHYLTGK